ncbi:ParA family protein [Thaumasiovibrio sp. DFM-14]|uniref:ParA family protein n=1 Tax=Thaumasiovibrio sp. DFM-14 TaxID=3384792 RepID=UPI0039A353CB
MKRQKDSSYQSCGLKSAPGCKVLIMNRKGGAGKSTFAIALASVLSSSYRCELIDFDTQRTSQHWGNISGIVESQHFQFDTGQLFSLAVKVDRRSDVILMDTPSNFSMLEMERYLSLADRIIVPLQPSPIDIHAILNFIGKLIHSPTYRQRRQPIAFVATRNGKGEQGLEQFKRVLKHLRHPVLGGMTNSPLYQQAFEQGVNFMTFDPVLDLTLWRRTCHWLKLPIEAAKDEGAGHDTEKRTASRYWQPNTDSIRRSRLPETVATP